MRQKFKSIFPTVGIILFVLLIIVALTIVAVNKYWQEPDEADVLTVDDIDLTVGNFDLNNYTWIKAADGKRYKNVVWQTTTASILAGFAADNKAVEKRTEGGWGFDTAVLRREGCLASVGYWVEITQGGKVEKIDTLARLKDILLPIDSANKAVGLVALTTGDLQMRLGVLVGHSAPISDGYLVRAVENNTCGCSTHIPEGVIYKVARDGAVTIVAREIVPIGAGPEICVD